MPFLIPIAVVIASAISAAIVAVAAAIGPILAAVGAAIAVAAAAIAAVTVTVVTALVTALTWFGSYVVAQIGWLSNWMTLSARSAYTWFSGYVASISHTFEAILEAIHFKTIMQIHSIVYIVSPQYRAMMVKVYDAIGNASKALGLGPQFLTLAIQNTRNLVLDVTGMFGQRYDLGQVSWMATLNKYLNHFNTYAYKYANNPEAVFWDLAELIERPAQDAKGSFQLSMIQGLETALEFAAQVGKDLHRLGIDVETLYHDLPEFIKSKIPAPSDTFWPQMTGWLNEWYIPTMNALNTEISSWADELEAAQGRTSELVDKLRKPGDMMKALDNLPSWEREQQEDLLDEYTNRRLARVVLDLMPTFTSERNRLEANARIPIPPPTVSPPLSYEPAYATVVGPGTMVPRRTWFVGDF
ncbi:MAG: hypothetical protein ACXAEN_20545 [Candidatus Thorarchaeota archaeon]|jgi:hypothetical protein